MQHATVAIFRIPCIRCGPIILDLVTRYIVKRFFLSSAENDCPSFCILVPHHGEYPGADPGILERGGGGKEAKPRTERRRRERRREFWGPPPENLEKLDAISCILAYIFGIRMASDIIQNWAFAEQKTVAATISIHTHTHTPPTLPKTPRTSATIKSKFNFKNIFRHCRPIKCKKLN